MIGVGRPTRISGRGREAHTEVRQGLEGPPGSLGGDGSPNRRSKGIGRPTRRSGRSREANPEVRKGVERPTWWFGTGWEELEGLPVGPGGVRRPTRRSDFQFTASS